MSIDLEEIRSRNSIETIVGERFPLRKSGSRFVGVEHDSLVVVPNTGMYFWNSKGEHGDVFDFVGGMFCPWAHGISATVPSSRKRSAISPNMLA